MPLPHLPLLRGGRPYRSLDRVTLRDVRGGDPVVEVSQANRGLIARDLLAAPARRRALAAVPVAELLAICRRAGGLFAEADLPLDPEGGEAQSPQRYLDQLAATTGLPIALGRRNLAKIRWVLEHMEEVLAGLTRGLDPGALDAYLCQTDALGLVLPGNSPGVHTLWLPAVALQVPVALKPGREEPWSPWRIAQALLAAGCPPAALGYYPTDHAGAAEILLRCGRSLLFGDRATVGSWAEDRRVEVHGPGWSKVILGADEAAAWETHLGLIVASVAENGGRSCLNASGVWVGGTNGSGRALAGALAERLAAFPARPLDHPEAALAAFPDPARARKISAWIDAMLRVPGAVDLTAGVRGTPRVAEVDGCTFLLPTVVWCDDPEHPLATTELLFPFVSVLELPQEEIAARLGPTLVATVLTRDERLAADLLACRAIDRLNLGPVPTPQVAWGQPHEGNLFDHLYRRRAFASVPLPPPAATASSGAAAPPVSHAG